jgi:hypothetical protein
VKYRKSEIHWIVDQLVFFRTMHDVFVDSRNVCCSSHCTDALGSNRMVQPATLQGNQLLASDNCSPDGWFPDMETFLSHPGLQIWQLQIFLWGYLKERENQTKPRTSQELKDSIRREILSTQQETLTLVMECVVRRVQHCAALRGVNLPKVIFRT